MSSLPQFLIQIGVESLSSQVALPKSGVKPALALLYDRIQAEIDSVTDETRITLESSWPEFQKQSQLSSDLIARAEEQEHTLRALEDELVGESTFLPHLVTTLTSHAQLVTRHADSSKIIESATAILELHTSISQLADSISAGALSQATSTVMQVRTLVHGPTAGWIKATEGWTALEQWAAEEEVRLEKGLVDAFGDCFRFTLDENTLSSSLTISQEVAAVRNGPLLSIVMLLDSLAQLAPKSSQQSVQGQLDQLAKRLQRHFIVPLLERNGCTHTLEGRVEIIYGEGTLQLRPITASQSAVLGNDSTAADLERLLAFFGRDSQLLQHPVYAPLLTSHLTPPVQSLIISHYLRPSLPDTIAGLGGYLSVLSSASTFERSFLPAAGYFAFLSSNAVDERTVIQEWMSRVDVHWAKQVGAIALEKVRHEISKGDWEAEVVEVYVEDDSFDEEPVEEVKQAEPVIPVRRPQASTPPALPPSRPAPSTYSSPPLAQHATPPTIPVLFRKSAVHSTSEAPIAIDSSLFPDESPPLGSTAERFEQPALEALPYDIPVDVPFMPEAASSLEPFEALVERPVEQRVEQPVAVESAKGPVEEPVEQPIDEPIHEMLISEHEAQVVYEEKVPHLEQLQATPAFSDVPVERDMPEVTHDAVEFPLDQPVYIPFAAEREQEEEEERDVQEAQSLRSDFQEEEEEEEDVADEEDPWGFSDSPTSSLPASPLQVDTILPQVSNHSPVHNQLILPPVVEAEPIPPVSPPGRATPLAVLPITPTSPIRPQTIVTAPLSSVAVPISPPPARKVTSPISMSAHIPFPTISPVIQNHPIPASLSVSNGLPPPDHAPRERFDSDFSTEGLEDAWGFGDEGLDEEEASEDKPVKEEHRLVEEAIIEQRPVYPSYEDTPQGTLPNPLKLVVQEADDVSSEELQLMEDGGDDGWGFGDDPEEVEGSSPVDVTPHAQLIVSESGEDDEDAGDDAWGFDADIGAEEGGNVPEFSASTLPYQDYSQEMPTFEGLPTPIATVHDADRDSYGWDEELQMDDLDSPPASGPESHAEPLRAGDHRSVQDARLRQLEGGRMEPTAITPISPGKSSRAGVKNRKAETRLISTRSKGILSIAKNALEQATAISDPRFLYPTFSSSAPLFLRTFISILSLYRATAPIQYETLINEVPALGMQYANDCEWMGEEVIKVWKSFDKGKGREREEQEVSVAVSRLIQMGVQGRTKQISIQQVALMEILDDANRFLYTGDPARYSACERAIKQVAHTLERLSIIWKPIMNSTAFYAALGSLVNMVLTRVLTEIEDQADISEAESIKLNRLCKILHDLGKLFVDGAEISAVGREVPIWFKFVFLSELLEASMADILFLFNNGHLIDFSTQEIAKLVRALFSDSPLRTKNLQHILNGHPEPDVLEDDDMEGWR